MWCSSAYVRHVGPCTQDQPRAGLRGFEACGRRLAHRGQLCRRALPERPSPQCGSRECLLASGNLRFICGAPPKLVFDTGFFVHFPNTPPPSLFVIFATLYWVLGPPGLDSRGDGAASALQGATSRELRPILSPPGCNRPGGGDLGSGVCGERGDL